jgi:hypothetical protein
MNTEKNPGVSSLNSTIVNPGIKKNLLVDMFFEKVNIL